MKLNALTEGLDLERVAGDPGADPDLTGLTIDVEEVHSGSLFVARQGYYGDGHDQIDEAIRRGAAAVIVAHRERAPRDGTPALFAPSPDRALGALADRFTGHPTRQLKVYGVTGTNGKTSVAYLVEHLLSALGERPAVMGTISYRLGAASLPAVNTTPDSLFVHRFARAALDAGATALVLEVSSHALGLGRVEGVAFDSVGFTNLSHDHLDFHHDLDSYFAAKRRLFTEVLDDSAAMGKTPVGAVDIDTEWGERLMVSLGGEHRFVEVTTAAPTPQPPSPKRERRSQAHDVGSGGRAQFDVDGSSNRSLLPNAPRWAGSGDGPFRADAQAREATMIGGSPFLGDCPSIQLDRLSLEGVSESLEGMATSLFWRGARHEARSPLVGRYNLSNLALASAMVLATHPDAAEGLAAAGATFHGVPGRMERVAAGEAIFVDYAHTPDALIKAASELARVAGCRPVIVVGCGGDRDPSKRGPMARAAAEHGEVAFLTSDNPRSEDPDAILQAMEDGLDSRVRTPVLLEVSREKAIEAAVRLGMRPLLIAGKGHETYQEVAGRRFHLDDREEARRALAAATLDLNSDDTPLLDGWLAAGRAADDVLSAALNEARRRQKGLWTVLLIGTSEQREALKEAWRGQLEGRWVAIAQDQPLNPRQLTPSLRGVVFEASRDERIPDDVDVVITAMADFPATTSSLQPPASAEGQQLFSFDEALKLASPRWLEILRAASERAFRFATRGRGSRAPVPEGLVLR